MNFNTKEHLGKATLNYLRVAEERNGEIYRLSHTRFFETGAGRMAFYAGASNHGLDLSECHTLEDVWSLWYQGLAESGWEEFAEAIMYVEARSMSTIPMTRDEFPSWVTDGYYADPETGKVRVTRSIRENQILRMSREERIALVEQYTGKKYHTIRFAPGCGAVSMILSFEGFDKFESR